MGIWQATRSLFPVTRTGLYLDHARAGPLPSRVDEAVRQFVDEASRRSDPDHEAEVRRELARVRERLATLLGAGADEIAFVSHALEGWERVADDVDWQRGDVVVSAGPVTPPPLMRLALQGVEVHNVPLDKGVLRADRLDQALRHPRARLLALSVVEARSGARSPLAAAGRLCRERGVLLSVDASHAIGCLALDVGGGGIDYLVADAHRFLLGLSGTGVLFRSRRSASDGLPAEAVFEAGPANALGIVALGSAVDLLLELGMPATERRLLALVGRLRAGLEARGIPITTPGEGPDSGILCFRIDGEAPGRTAERLLARGIVVSTTAAGVRVSPHAYLEDAEIDALLEAL